jgi:hypothetical protein
LEKPEAEIDSLGHNETLAVSRNCDGGIKRLFHEFRMHRVGKKMPSLRRKEKRRQEVKESEAESRIKTKRNTSSRMVEYAGR